MILVGWFVYGVIGVRYPELYDWCEKLLGFAACLFLIVKYSVEV